MQKIFKTAFAIALVAGLSACQPATTVYYGGGGGGTQVTSPAASTPAERVEDTYGPGVGYSDSTQTAAAGSGGQQQAGDSVSSRSVDQADVGPSAAGPGEASTASGNEAPGFD